VSPAKLQVGRASAVITPSLPSFLAGYFHERVARRVRDDLYARALVVSGERVVALVTLDLAHVHESVVEPAKALIEERLGIGPEAVMVSATHTHTGPEVAPNEPMPVCAELVEKLPGIIASVVEEAVRDASPSELRPGRTEVHGYSFNRLFRLLDGGEVFGKRQGADIIGGAGEIEPELLTLAAVGPEDRLLALAVGFALHPDVIGGGTADFISADWPGEIAKNVAAVYGPDAMGMFLQGTCGDINHVTHVETRLPRGGPAKAVALGRALAGAAMVAAERAEPMEDATVRAALETLEIPYYTRDEAFLRQLRELEAKAGHGELTPFERHTLDAGEAWPHDGKVARVPIQAMRIGQVGLVALPAEIFSSIGREIRRYSPFPHTFVVEQANARSSVYVPAVAQAERGAYGAVPILSRWLCADAGRRMGDAAIRLLHSLART
jgi:neutral ceramidase